MICQDGNLFLEFNLTRQNISELQEFSGFCNGSIWVTRLISIPLGIAIMVLTASAFAALSSLRQSQLGTGIIFKSALILDFLNGLGCFRLFEQYVGRKELSFDKDIYEMTMTWVTYLIIYTSWLLKFFLCLYALHRYLAGNVLVRWYPAGDLSNSRPLSRNKGWIVVIGAFCVSLAEMVTIFVLRKTNVHYDHGKYLTIPFLGVENLLQWSTGILVGILWLLTRTQESASWYDKFVTGTIGLSSLSAILSSTFLVYGDLSCFFPYNPPHLIKPICFLPFARFIYYLDSTFFPLIQFRSATVRRNFWNTLLTGRIRSWTTSRFRSEETSSLVTANRLSTSDLGTCISTTGVEAYGARPAEVPRQSVNSDHNLA